MKSEKLGKTGIYWCHCTDSMDPWILLNLDLAYGSSRSTRLTQLMCANTFCSSLIYKLSPSFRSPTCKGMNKWQTKWETHPSAESWPRHPGTEPFHAAHTDVRGIYSLFSLSTPSTTLHSMGNPAWDWLSASCWTSTAALRGQQSAQPLSSGFCNSQHGLFSF